MQGGGIFLEASEQPNWIDHNLIWNVKGSGFYQHDSDGLVVFNNLIGQCTDHAVRMQVCTDRKLYDRVVTCKRPPSGMASTALIRMAKPRLCSCDQATSARKPETQPL